jgi:hypothetical protein
LWAMRPQKFKVVSITVNILGIVVYEQRTFNDILSII